MPSLLLRGWPPQVLHRASGNKPPSWWAVASGAREPDVVAVLGGMVARLRQSDQKLVKRCYARSSITSVGHIKLDSAMADGDVWEFVERFRSVCPELFPSDRRAPLREGQCWISRAKTSSALVRTGHIKEVGVALERTFAGRPDRATSVDVKTAKVHELKSGFCLARIEYGCSSPAFNTFKITELGAAMESVQNHLE